MPTVCAIYNCTNVQRQGFHMFSIPKVRIKEGESTKQLSERRRREWLKAINRKGLTDKTVKRHHLVCQDHFVTGRPAYLHDETNVDWVPSLRLGHSGVNALKKQRAHQTARKIKEKRHSALAVITDTVDIDLIEEDETDTSDPDMVCEDTPEENDKGVYVQTEAKMVDISVMSEQVNKMTTEIVELKSNLQRIKFDEQKFMENEENVRYYTGLPNWEILQYLVTYLTQYMQRHPAHMLTAFQEIILVCMKLRLNLSNKLLGDLFGIHRTTVSSVFLRVLNMMYHALQPLIYWPEKEEIMETMPSVFIRNFGRKVRVIIDCFEIFIVRPSNVRARAKTYSNYKHSNTIKYLIGITPQGSISYLSQGYGGRASDKYVTENSGFLEKLEPYDLILADRGFDISDSVGLRCAEIKIPAFTRGKKQLSPYDVENTRKLANVRIHVERVIGNIQVKYKILGSVIPLDYLSTSEEEDVTTLDRIITVCACLTNLCPSVVPS